MDPKLSKFEAEIDRFLQAKMPLDSIINYFQKDPKSIYNAIYRIKRKKRIKICQDRAKRGRNPEVSDRAKRAINRDITRSPKKTKSRLLKENNLDISSRTLQRVLKAEDWTINKSTKKPILDATRARKRLAVAKERLTNLSNDQVTKIIFSDESGIQRGHGARSEFFRKRGKKRLGQALVSTTNTSKLYLIILLYLTTTIYLRIFYFIRLFIANLFN